jgi:hypothetical protein
MTARGQHGRSSLAFAKPPHGAVPGREQEMMTLVVAAVSVVVLVCCALAALIETLIERSGRVK